jgi:hypothetical protein
MPNTKALNGNAKLPCLLDRDLDKNKNSDPGGIFVSNLSNLLSFFSQHDAHSSHPVACTVLVQ